MIRRFKFAAKLAIVMFVMTIICIFAWGNCVFPKLYDNTDDNLAGYLGPFWGNFWVGQGGFPIVYVEHVVHGRSMSDPDEIKLGWSIPKLFGLWLSFFTISVVTSIVLARIRWLPHPARKQMNEASRTV